MAAYSDVLFIEKLGAHPFQFTYVQTNITFHEVYRNPELIRLHSTVPADDMFRTHVLVANVASLASAMVAKDVRMYCDQVRDLVFRSELDALVMTTLVALG